jgi:hypothetical protein
LNEIRLVKGEVYFYCTFYDKDLKIPSISTFIFEGVEDEYGYIFRNANGEEGLYSFEIGEMNSVLDHEQLSLWARKEHSPRIMAEEYTYIVE